MTILEQYAVQMCRDYFGEGMKVPTILEHGTKEHRAVFANAKHIGRNSESLIVFNRSYARNSTLKELRNTLLHELIHSYCYQAGLKHHTHGKEFVAIAASVGCNIDYLFERGEAGKRRRKWYLKAKKERAPRKVLGVH